MSRSLPPLAWFRAFEAAASHQSFTAAAEELGLTQSAISQQIRSLESRLGCRLFERRPRGVSLTDDARKLLPEVRMAIDTLRQATASYEEQQGNLLTIATSVSVAQWYLAPKLSEFIANFERLDVRLMTTVWPDTLADNVDVQIRFGTDEGQAALGQNRLVLVANPALIAKHKLPLSNDEVNHYPIIQAVGTTDTWLNRAESFDLQARDTSSIYVDSHGLAVDLARNGSGIALTSELIALPLLSSGELVSVNSRAVPAEDGYYIGVSSETNRVISNRFVQWLHHEVQKLK